MSMPMPNISDIFAQIGKAKYFTFLDCVSGFHPIAIHSEDRRKTAFSTSTGHYQYRKMCFGLINASREFQHAINTDLI